MYIYIDINYKHITIKIGGVKPTNRDGLIFPIKKNACFFRSLWPGIVLTEEAWYLQQLRGSKLTWRVLLVQWPFQEPKLEVPTIYKAYIRPM